MDQAQLSTPRRGYREAQGSGRAGKVLIVDDDDKLLKLLHDYLEEYGFQVVVLVDGASVLPAVQTQAPDLVILDILLPDMHGLDVLQEVRTVSAVPVIMLTSRGEEADRIVGLELGADDYLPKPFNPRELLARIRAVLRRLPPDPTPASEADERHLITAGNVTLNTASHSLTIDGGAVTLSNMEYQLLKALMEHPNTVLSRGKLMSLVHGKDFVAFDRSVDVHISKLRAKLETDSSISQPIKTVWGVGYMFVDS